MSYREHDFEDPFDPVEFVEHLMQSVVSRQRRKDALEVGPKRGSNTDLKSSPKSDRWSPGTSQKQGGETPPATTSHGKKKAELPSAEVDSFDPQSLLSAFDEALVDLNALSERVERRVDKLMKVIQKEEAETKGAVKSVEKSVENASSQFQELDDRINNVAKKVVHLGDQLEGVNATRSRAEDALQLMGYFAKFHDSEEVDDDVFMVSSRIHEAALIMHKLHLIALELPQDRFLVAKERIAYKYVAVQRTVVKRFEDAYATTNVEEMKQCANTLLPFGKGYEDCMSRFIELAQQGQFTGKDIFADIASVVNRVSDLILKIFENAEIVLSKFVSSVYAKHLQKHIIAQLKKVREPDLEVYLKTLNELYMRTTKLSSTLSKCKMGNDSGFLTRMTKSVFKQHLEDFMTVELDNLTERCSGVLNEHKDIIAQRKAATTGLRRKANDDVCEDLVSHELAATILHEHKAAMLRCANLSAPTELPQNAAKLFDALMDSLVNQHLMPAVEVGLNALPSAEPKNPPDISFLRLVENTSSIIQLLEKHFRDFVVPAVGSSPIHADCLHQKKELFQNLQGKLDTGVDRCISAQAGYIRYILNNEQKKSDFRPEDGAAALGFTPACNHAAAYLNAQLQRILQCVDGKNLQACLMELGTRFHRVLIDHLQQFTYSYTGGMVAICDINEYRKCIKKFKVPLLDTLMEVLHSLCNMLIVAPENLRQIMSEEANLASIDRQVVLNFIQLRVDNKSGKLAKILNF
ncbi:exocyst complex component 5-like [Sycon ciliatum]|uniref:exocyst complex component 5-like n=1 Tax=Sycon ciliatum TaxID=27933 RepID=UPI0020A86B60|eukprot:scpid21567/ scgid10931/ Exocyst complex component 5; Exocyst complex component Sec10